MNNFKIKSLKIKNYKRFENQFIDLSGRNIVLITGRNLDTPGSDSNGSGKSAILSAISWCITGQVVESKAERLITYGKDECYVEVVLTNGIVITRKATDKSKKIKIYKEFKKVIIKREEILNEATNSQKQDYINNLFQFDTSSPKSSFTHFLNSIYFDPEGINIFTSSSLNNKEKLEFFSKYFNLEFWDECSIASNEIAKKLASDISSIQVDYTNKQNWLNENETIDGIPLSEVKSRLEEDLKEINFRIKKLKEESKSLLVNKNSIKELAELKQERQDLNNKSLKYKDLLKKLEADLKENSTTIDLKNEKIKQLQIEGEKLVDEVPEKYLDLFSSESIEMDLKTELNLASKTITRLKSQKQLTSFSLNNSTVCPKCKTNLLLDNNKLSIFSEEYKTKLERSVKKIDKELSEHTKDLEALQFIQYEILTKLRTYQKEKESVEYLEEKIEEIKNNLENTKQECNSLDANIVKIDNKIKKLEDIVDVNAAEKYDEIMEELNNLDYNKISTAKEIGTATAMITTIKEVKKKLKEDLEESDKLTAKKAIAEYWVREFKKLKSLILDDNFYHLNSLTNQYLKKLGYNYQFYIKSTEKFKTSDNIKFNLSIMVVDEYGADRNFYEFSKGEKTRILSAMFLALRELNKTSANFIFMDEYLNQLDETGELRMLELLHTFDMQGLIVTNSQSLKDNWNSDTLVVTRKNGVSLI